MNIKYKIIATTILSSTFLVACGNDKKPETVNVTMESSEAEKVGYTVGYAMSENYKQQFANIDLDAFAQGFKDSYADKDSVLTEEQMTELMEAYGKKRQEEMRKEFEDMVSKNKEEGEKYLAENGKKEGVTTIDSGLQYKVIEEGAGESPKVTDLVTVHYEGKLINGEVFDGSRKDGKEDAKPVDFMLTHMIPGWKEGIPLMKKGAKYEFVIPSDLAYGETGNMGIEPNSTLIFTVELLDFKEAPKTK